MLANLPELFDSVLVVVGLALVVTGLVMFIYSKTSTGASSVEAFGIKLNVTHPSLILVLAGVGLMLAPRLLPGLPGKPDSSPPTEPPIIADAPHPPVAPTVDTSPTPALTPQPSQQASSVPKSTSSAKPAPTASQAPAHPARKDTSNNPAPTPSSAPARSNIATPAKPSPTPVIVTKPESRPPPAATPPEPITVAPAPTPTPVVVKPAVPGLAYAALGLPINRDFWSGETQTTYTRRMHNSLQQAGQRVLRMSPRNLNLDQAEFNRWWNESRDQPVSREYCASASAPRALVSARIETPTTSSYSESAYWPEFRLRLYLCATHRSYRQHKTLSPVNSDEWPFSTELNSDIERFMRTYRGDLAD